MMKKLLSFLMCVSLLSVGLFSCSSDDDEGGDDLIKVKLSASFKYMKEGSVTNSPFTTMYVYDTKGENTSEWTHDDRSHNMIRKDGTVVYPKYTFLSDIDGNIKEEIEAKINYLYVAICGVDPNQRYSDKFEAKANITIEKTLTAD